MNQSQPPAPPDTSWALDLLWVGLLILYVFAGYPATPFHGDESMQIYMSHDYAHLVQDRNPEFLRYNPDRPVTEQLGQELRIINGTLNKHTIGLAWNAAGFTRDDLNQPWYWDETYEFNVAGGFAPSDALLLASRIPSTLFLCAAISVFFFAGKAFAGRPAGYMVATYLALSPAVLLNGRRAMMEGSLLFGAGLTLLAALLLVQAKGWRYWVYVPLLGLGAGIAVASKHTNVIAVASIFFGCLLYAFVSRRWMVIAGVFVAGVLSLGVFFTLNPAYWGNPIEAANAVVAYRTSLLDGQVGVFGGYTNLGAQIAGFYRQVFDAQPMYAESDKFIEAMNQQSAVYEATPYSGVYMPGAGVALLGAFVLGTLIVLGQVNLPDVAPGTRWVVGTYAVVTVLFFMLGTPLEWQRYYLPVFPVVGMVAPLGIMWVVRLYIGDAKTHSEQFKKGSVRVQRS